MDGQSMGGWMEDQWINRWTRAGRAELGKGWNFYVIYQIIISLYFFLFSRNTIVGNYAKFVVHHPWGLTVFHVLSDIPISRRPEEWCDC